MPEGELAQEREESDTCLKLSRLLQEGPHWDVAVKLQKAEARSTLRNSKMEFKPNAVQVGKHSLPPSVLTMEHIDWIASSSISVFL